MKKILFGFTLLISILFTGCFNSVYYNINKDVPPLAATVTGTIRQITRYSAGQQEYLVVISDQGLLYKDAFDKNYNSWKKYEALPAFEPHHYDYYGSSDHVGQQMLATHADADTLYIITAEYKDSDDEGTSVPSKIRIYGKKISLAEDGITWSTDGDWTSILEDGSGIDYTPMYVYNTYYYSAFAIFSTNAIQPAHRKVYIRAGDPKPQDKNYSTAVAYYELSGTGAPTPISVTPVDYNDTELNKALSAAYFNGAVEFYNSQAVTTNETSDTDATVLYYGYDKHLFYKTTADATFVKSEFSLGQHASTICVCKDTLIVGRGNYNSSSNSETGGVVQVPVDENGIIGTTLTDFNSNIETQLQNCYFILSMININPAETQEQSSLYSSICFIGNGTTTSAKFKDIGLWSYYPERGNWNRE